MVHHQPASAAPPHAMSPGAQPRHPPSAPYVPALPPRATPAADRPPTSPAPLGAASPGSAPYQAPYAAPAAPSAPYQAPVIPPSAPYPMSAPHAYAPAAPAVGESSIALPVAARRPWGLIAVVLLIDLGLAIAGIWLLTQGLGSSPGAAQGAGAGVTR